jgi:conjugative transposon TraN protein
MKPLFCPTFLVVALLTFSAPHLIAQELQRTLPSNTAVAHYLLRVAYNTTTVLIFPAAIKPVDRGDADVLAQKQPGVENVLKLKAARRNFPQTNLHVFTADGKVYAFDIVYTDSLGSTQDLRLLDLPAGDSGPQIVLSDETLNAEQLQQCVTKLTNLPAIHHGAAYHANQMSIRLQQVRLAGPLLLFRFAFANHSNLDYHLDFVRLYVRDRQKAKRTSVQETEILPVFEEGTAMVVGDSSVTHVIAVPAFTLASGKQFVVEAYEKNGGRTLTLYIRNKTLLNAKKL